MNLSTFINVQCVDALKNTEPYHSGPFQDQRGPGLDGVGDGGVTDAGKLTCDFEEVCCWDNVELPEDESDWRLSRTALSDPVWQKYIGNVEKPSIAILNLFYKNTIQRVII
jgi:hypothetical protein